MEKDKLLKINPYFFVNTNVEKIHIADKNVYKIIKLCQSPHSIDVLLNDHKMPSAVIDLLLKHNIIMPLDMIWKQATFTTLDIEICTHCNFRCVYCPVSKNPKKIQFMEKDLFVEIINKAKNYPSITTIALNSYNEPLLDPDFINKLDIISKANIKVNLFTNGSLLNPDKLDAALEINVLQNIYFNISVLDGVAYRQKTGSDLFQKTIKNIEYAIKKNVDITLIVTSKGTGRSQILKDFNERYADYSNVKIMPNFVNDRAGLLGDEYAQNIQNKDKLTGCLRLINFLEISVVGDFFICCHDYYQREVFGNIKDGEFEDILKSEKAINLRKKVFGEIESTPEFICRKCYDMYNSQINVKSNKKFVFDEMS